MKSEEKMTVGQVAERAFEMLDSCLYSLFSNQVYDDKWTPKLRAENIILMMEYISNFYLKKYEEYKEYMNILVD